MADPSTERVPSDAQGAAPGSPVDDAQVQGECCVCLEPFLHPVDGTHGSAFDNALLCENQHLVCCACICKIARPIYKKRRARDTGLCYQCPLCRNYVLIQPLHVLVLLKSSWAKAIEPFGRPRSAAQGRCKRWSRGVAP